MAKRLDDVVDSTGAGDTFNAGVIAALSCGASVSEALHAGCHVAGQKVAQVGFDGLSLPKEQQQQQRKRKAGAMAL